MRLGSPVGHSDPSSQMSSRQNDRWATSRGGKARRNSVHLSCKPPVKIVAHELAQQQGHRWGWGICGTLCTKAADDLWSPTKRRACRGKEWMMSGMLSVAIPRLPINPSIQSEVKTGWGYVSTHLMSKSNTNLELSIVDSGGIGPTKARYLSMEEPK